MGAGDFLRVLMGGIEGGSTHYMDALEKKKKEEATKTELTEKYRREDEKFARDRNANILQAIAVERMKDKLARGEQPDFGEFLQAGAASPDDVYQMTLRKSLEPASGGGKTLQEQQFDWTRLKDMNAMNNQRVANEQKQKELEAGARLPADKAFLLAEGKDLPRVVDELKSSISANRDVMGPIMGRLRGANPWDDRAQTLNGQIKRVKQVVGKFLEGGVLRKEDEAKYDAILAGLSNDPDVAIQKLDELKTDLSQKYSAYLDSAKKAGYNVGEFQNANADSGRLSRYQNVSLEELLRKKAERSKRAGL